MYISLDNTPYYIYTGTHEPKPELETIVFVHGASMDHSVWSHQSRYFAYHGYNVLAVDLPGHRFSKGKLLSNIEDIAKWILQILNCVNCRAIHLVGHSMGALAALEAASQLRSDIHHLKTLSLVGFCYPMRVTPALLNAAKNNPSKAYSMMTQWSHASKTGGEPVPGFWSAGMQMSMMENNQIEAIHCNLEACNNYLGGEQAFARVECPILFISGNLDKMAPAKLAIREAERIKNSRIQIIDGCGHNIMFESPDSVLNSLNQFIRR